MGSDTAVTVVQVALSLPPPLSSGLCASHRQSSREAAASIQPADSLIQSYFRVRSLFQQQ